MLSQSTLELLASFLFASAANAQFGLPFGYTTRPFAVGNQITLNVQSPGYTNYYVSHSGSANDYQLTISPTSSANTTAEQLSATWLVTEPQQLFAPSGCFSLSPLDLPGMYVRSSDFGLYVQSHDKSLDFGLDATYCPATGLDGGQTYSIVSSEFPNRYFRSYAQVASLACDGCDTFAFDTPNGFPNDASFLIGTNGFALVAPPQPTTTTASGGQTMTTTVTVKPTTTVTQDPTTTKQSGGKKPGPPTTVTSTLKSGATVVIITSTKKGGGVSVSTSTLNGGPAATSTGKKHHSTKKLGPPTPVTSTLESGATVVIVTSTKKGGGVSIVTSTLKSPPTATSTKKSPTTSTITKHPRKTHHKHKPTVKVTATA